MKTYLMAVCCLGILFSSGFSQDPGKLSGLFYLDYSYNIGRDSSFAGFGNTALAGPKAFQSFQFRRIYFTYDYSLTEDFSTRFRLEADQAALSSAGKISTFVKDAYLRWKNIFGQSELFVGVQPTPAFEISEGIWGYRSLEKTIMDLRGIVLSRDLGIALRGKADEGGMFSYWFLVAIGAGNRPETDKYKRYYGNLQIKPLSGLTVTLYGDLMARSDITDPFSTATPKARVSNSMLTGSLFLGYTGVSNLRAGLEGYIQNTANEFNTGTALVTRKGRGISLFASYGIANNIDIVGRYDHFDPNTDGLSKGDSRGYLLGAVSWRVEPRVFIMPNIQIETYEKSPTGRSFDSSMTARITVAWQFP